LLAGSSAEERHYFDVYDTKRHVRVDCETATHVIEIGLDGKDSARDSVHQALFAAHLATGKIPAVILIDRDGYEGRFEYEMRQVTGMLGLAYANCAAAWLEGWTARGGMRVVPDDSNDLPREAWVASRCDLSQIVGPDPVVPGFLVPELPVTGVTGVTGVSAPLDPAGE
jgi:hypothetical protein